ncbi:hypothetical protein ACQKPX_24760 [Photobacterium sp. DNB23_23_1]
MSFNINLQKTNKDSSIPDRLVVRRFWYDSESKKQKSKTIFTANKYSAPVKLPEDIIAKHDVTTEELEKYHWFVMSLHTKMNEESLSTGIETITRRMAELTEKLTDRSDGVTLSEIEKFEESYTAFKKQLTRHKRNAKKRGDEALALQIAKEQGQGDLMDTLEGEK